jgi:hypothetical protein
MKCIHSFLLRRLFLSKRFYLWLLIWTGLGVRVVMHGADSRQTTPSLWLDVYYRMLNDHTVLYIIIPFFLLLLGLIPHLFDRYQVLLKYDRAKRWWKAKNEAMLLFTMIFTGVIHLVILGVVVASGKVGSITGAFLSFLLFSFFMQFICLMMLGIVYQLVSLLTRSYIGYFVTLLGIILFETLMKVCKWQFYKLSEYVSLLYKLKADQLSIDMTDMFTLFCFLLIWIALYWVGSTLSTTKDYHWKG